MLTGEDSLLRRISKRLDLDVAVEFQTLDCVYYYGGIRTDRAWKLSCMP